jgi:endoglucanase
METFDAVIAALAHEGLVVILDNHASRADWCCDTADGNGLWYSAAYPESKWIADWQAMALRYANQPAVVGADLRNELRSVLDANAPAGCTSCGGGCTCKTAAWGGNDPSVDWHAAATRGGNAVLATNGSLLVFVEGINYATDLTGIYSLPITLQRPNRLVYEAHDYAWDHNGETTYAQIKTTLGNSWGYILTQNQSYTAPIWVGEFGTCHGDASCVASATGQGFWFDSIRRYLVEADIDWSYWALNGTQASGTGRTFGGEESYGVLDTTWTKPALTDLSAALGAIAKATQGP